MSYTLANSKQYLRDYDFDNNGTRGDRIYTKITNDALREIYSAGDFDFTNRIVVYDFQAMYNTGTVSVSYNGTTVTGVGTTFVAGTTPAGMVGQYIRFNAEAMQYRITAVGSGTSLTISNDTDTRGYIGNTAGLSGVSYQITDERRPAIPPSGEPFRQVKRVLVDSGVANSGPMFNLYPLERMQLERTRKYSRVAMIPRMYAFEWVLTSATQPITTPTAYIWIHPPPDIIRTVTMEINVWPIPVTSDTDVCPIPYEAEPVLREFLRGFLYQEQGRKEEAQAQMARANGMAMRALAVSRGISDSNQRRPWFPDYDDHGAGMGWQTYWPTIDPNTPLV